MARENMMPIGRFSRACRLSIKALRHYDEEGLLRPAHVDVATGYRYYARSQARQAVVIGMLRSLGVGVAAVRKILAADDDGRQALLEQEVARLQHEVAAKLQALHSIRRLARAGALLPYEVSLRSETPTTVARRSLLTDAERLIADTTALIHALFDELRSAGRPILMPVLCMNEERDGGDRILVHACAGLEPPYVALPEADVAELPGGPFAALTHRGPYEELGLAYHALHAWAQEHGHEPRGLIREIYVNDPAVVAAEELITEVLMPI